MSDLCESFFLHSGARRLFASWHGTDGRTPGRAALFCHPLGEEKKCGHRAFVETARALQRRGIASLRFDMSGCGDSDDAFENFSTADWLDDILFAWKELRRRAPAARCALIGLRFGAALAALALERLSDVAALALWQPVVNGKEEFTSDLRRVLIQRMITDGSAGTDRAEILARLESGEGRVEVDGYAVTGALYRGICTMDLASMRKEFPKATTITQFSRSNRRIEAFAEAAGIESRVVDVPPIWIRSDFIPNAETGDILAADLETTE